MPQHFLLISGSGGYCAVFLYTEPVCTPSPSAHRARLHTEPVCTPSPSAHRARLHTEPDIVLTSGVSVAQGEFFRESARSTDDCYGLRRVLPATRVREIMIVPVSA